jgi:hypothetical protein
VEERRVPEPGGAGLLNGRDVRRAHVIRKAYLRKRPFRDDPWSGEPGTIDAPELATRATSSDSSNS